MQRALLYVLIGASYLLLAGGPRWALIALLAVAGLAVAAGGSRVMIHLRHPRGVDRWLLVVPGVVALQMVPLPAGLLAMVSPQSLALGDRLRLASGYGARPLSLDPAATAVALGTMMLAVLTYLTARSVFDTAGGARRLSRVLAWGAAGAALLALAQRAAAPHLLMGLVAPEAPGARPIGPFVNRNHFAGWLMMTVPVVAGYLVAHLRHHLADEREWRRRLRYVLDSVALPLAAALAVILAVLLLTLSRSALVGCGVAGAVWWLLARPRLALTERGWLMVVGAAGVALLAMATLVDVDALAVRLERSVGDGPRPDDRLVIWRETLPLLGDFWLTGTGAGTYGMAMLGYQDARIWLPHLAAWAHFNQAHNHYLQVLAEGGLLVGVPVALALGTLTRDAWRALAGDQTEIFWIRAGAAGALAGVAVQSVWEVPLVMPANAVLAAVLAALVLHEPPAARARGAGAVDQRLAA